MTDISRRNLLKGATALLAIGAIVPGVYVGKTEALNVRIHHMTTIGRDFLPPVDGMMVYNSDTNIIEWYSGSSWQPLPA